MLTECDSEVLDVGFATVQRALETAGERPAGAQPLTILEVQKRFEEIAAVRGPESMRVRQRLLEELFGRASKKEQQVLMKSIFGEMRIGVNEGVMIEAAAHSPHLDAAASPHPDLYCGGLV